MFQYPCFVSMMVNTFSPTNFGSIFSSVGVMWCSLLRALFRSLGSKQIRILPSGFLRYTREFTHYVGTSTFLMISFFSMSSSSVFMSSRSFSATLRCGCIAEGTLGSKVMRYMSSNSPTPPKHSGNSVRRVSFPSIGLDLTVYAG